MYKNRATHKRRPTTRPRWAWLVRPDTIRFAIALLKLVTTILSLGDKS